MFAPCRRASVLRGSLALCLAALVPAVAPAQYATPVAIRGQVAPDTGANAFFIGFERPALNAAGQVAFLGLFPGTGQGGDTVAGVFVSRASAGASVTGTPPNLTGSALQGTLTEYGLFAGPIPTGPGPFGSQIILQANGTVDPGPADA